MWWNGEMGYGRWEKVNDGRVSLGNQSLIDEEANKLQFEIDTKILTKH